MSRRHHGQPRRKERCAVSVFELSESGTPGRIGFVRRDSSHERGRRAIPLAGVSSAILE